MRRDGVPITQAAYQHGVSTGISYGARMMGLVPPWEEYDAMCTAGYTEDSWQAAPWRVRARAVAAYRLRSWIALHTDDARASAARAAQRAAQAAKR